MKEIVSGSATAPLELGHTFSHRHPILLPPLLLLLLLLLPQMKGCGPEWDSEDNLVWRGLRLRIGMSYGMVSNQKPLNTGHADYFGVLPNGAARVMALATPGQVRPLLTCPWAPCAILGEAGLQRSMVMHTSSAMHGSHNACV
jgi:hypothetical protein